MPSNLIQTMDYLLSKFIQQPTSTNSEEKMRNHVEMEEYIETTHLQWINMYNINLIKIYRF
jgi:hypothetical protein